MPPLDQLAWSTEVAAADWVAARLDSGARAGVAWFVPSGFAAYARLLHPAPPADPSGRPVRWREVAAWSGLSLEPDCSFHEVALPAEDPGTPPPCTWQGPPEGTLDPADAAALCRVLRRHTATPGDCWFCLWDGYDVRGTPLSAAGTGPAEPGPDPIPAEIRHGPRVRLPDRDHLFYRGPVEHAVIGPPGRDLTANLWWPADRAWCVATEIDLPWTYVGGSPELLAALVAEPGIEAQPTSLDAAPRGPAPWVARAVDDAVVALLSTGQATVTTAVGTVAASLERSGWQGRQAVLRTETTRFASSYRSGGSRAVPARDEEALARHLTGYLTVAVTALVGGS